MVQRQVEGAEYLECQQVALQAVAQEDGLSAEHAEQHRLHVPQSDGGVVQVLLRNPREPTP